MRLIKNTSTFGLALAAAIFLAAPVQAACDSFPKVPWWGDLNHGKVVSYVARKHKGDWVPYMQKWSNQVDKLTDVHERRSAVYVRYNGKKVKISGNALGNYIKLVKKRVEVTQCVAVRELEKRRRYADNSNKNG